MGRGSARDRGWRFVPSASPVSWRGTSLRGSGSCVVTELTCGPPSTASSPTCGTRPSGPPATSVLWGGSGACGPPIALPPVVVLPKSFGPHPSRETVAVLRGWVTVRGTVGHISTAPRGTVIETDRGVALQLEAEPLTRHVVVAVLQWGAKRPQSWRDPIGSRQGYMA